jgi:hypothetical protein
MTEVETIMLLNKKREELKNMRSANASNDTIKALEEEIENLASSIASHEVKPEERQVFIDECAG